MSLWNNSKTTIGGGVNINQQYQDMMTQLAQQMAGGTLYGTTSASPTPTKPVIYRSKEEIESERVLKILKLLDETKGVENAWYDETTGHLWWKKTERVRGWIVKTHVPDFAPRNEIQQYLQERIKDDWIIRKAETLEGRVFRFWLEPVEN